MANRLPVIFQQFFTANPTVREGSALWSYAAGTDTPLSTYKDKDLTPGLENTNPIVLDELGQPPYSVFLQNLGYKFVLKDETGATVWTEDNVFTSDYSARAKLQGYNGDPNGHVAGTEASATVGGDVIWDFANDVMYVCTTTGNAASAVWTAVNLLTAVSVVPMPQGYLTLTSGTPAITGDVLNTSTVYYALDQGNLVPIYNGTSFVPTAFTELTLSLVSAHTASAIYDVFVFSNDGVLTLATGPAWTTNTPGSGARGTGASTTQISRLNGIYVNTVSITGRNGANTYSIAANRATYLGSIRIDAGFAGQVSCHRTWGASRRWNVWNAYNKKTITLRGGDSTGSWTYNTNTTRQSNGGSGNSIQTFCGLPDDTIELSFSQVFRLGVSSGATASVLIGIGVNSTTVMSGQQGIGSTNGTLTLVDFTVVAQHYLPPMIGLNDINATENITATTGGTKTFFGGEGNMTLKAIWLG